MVTTRVAASDAGRYGVVQVQDGRIVDYAKPSTPASDLVANEVFVFDPVRLLELLDELSSDGLADVGDGLLPRMVADGAAREHRLDGYWRDLGTVEAYWAAHLELVSPQPPFVPDDADWPLVTGIGRTGGARVLAGARADIGAGARIGGPGRVTLVAERVGAGSTVAPGAHQPPD